ncbi:hypothetical protein ES703_40969 [subsurface metagenome]
MKFFKKIFRVIVTFLLVIILLVVISLSASFTSCLEEITITEEIELTTEEEVTEATTEEAIEELTTTIEETTEEVEETTEEEIPEAPKKETAYVIRVIDGDTIEIDLNGKVYKVRYIGINSPEYNQPFGDEATQANSSLVSGKTVILEKDVSETDKYGRLLRYVYVGNLFVNAHLVKYGWAQASTYPPDVKYSDLFVSLEREARENNLGCWFIPEETEEEPPPPTEEEPPPPTEEEPPPPAEEEPPPPTKKFVGSKKSDVYHYPTCRYVKKILPENIIWFSSVEDAKARGYRPCKVCKPPG